MGAGTLGRMVLSRLERRLERLVEGAFAKAFRSGLQPVEVGRRIVREMDTGRTLGVRGPVVPNRFRVWLAPDDCERFESFAQALAQEFAAAVKDHARDEGYHFLGPVTVELAEDPSRKTGSFGVEADIAASERPATASLTLPDGRELEIGATLRIGRMSDCQVQLSDPQTSRHHVEIRAVPGGHLLCDLASTNGTEVNGVRVAEHLLVDGDRITIGSTHLAYRVEP